MKTDYKKASLTVEAALALPIFIFAVLFVGYFMRVLYIQENLQHALDQTANQMAVYANVYHKMGLKDVQQEVYAHYKAGSGQIDQIMDEVIHNTYGIVDSFQNLLHLGDSKIKVEKPKEVEKYSEGQGLKEQIEAYIKQTTQIIEEVTQTTSQLYEAIHGLSENIKTILVHKDQLGAYAKQDGFELIIDTIGIQGAQQIFKTYLNEEEINKYYIVNGYKGLDFGRSQFMLENEDIDLVLTYRIKIPIPLKIVEEIPLMNRVMVRAWTGNHYGSSSQPALEELEMVYVARSALESEVSVYHTVASCYHINRISQPLLLSQVKDILPCELCVKDLDNLPDHKTVYITTRAGERFHIDQQCSAITRYVLTVPLGDLGEKARECTNCMKIKGRGN
jgi:hypothetical protein